MPREPPVTSATLARIENSDMKSMDFPVTVLSISTLPQKHGPAHGGPAESTRL
jgi:hypothetical protein